MERNAKFQWIFCLLLGCATSLVAQNVANWGLTHPQPKETLPKSKAQIMMPTPKTQTPVEAVVEKVGENDFLLNRGWKLTDGKNGWYNATVPGTVLTTLVDQGVYPDPYYGLNNLAIPDTLCRMDWWYRLECSYRRPGSLAGFQRYQLSSRDMAERCMPGYNERCFYPG